MDTLAVSFLLYTLGIVALGIYSARFSKRTSSDFFLANRGLGAWVAALSSSASAESGWVTLGLVGIAFETGVGALWIIPGTVAAFLFNWIVLAPRLCEFSRKTDSLTIPDILAARYTGLVAIGIRIVSVIVILSMLTAYVAAQLNAAGKTFSGTFQWSYLTGVLVGAAIVLTYTVSGGFRAVAWTDVVQATLMIAAVIGLPILLVAKVGGPAEAWARLCDADTMLSEPFAGNTGLALIGFMAVWLGVPLGNFGQPHILVRLMAVKDRAAIRRGTLISSLWVFFLFLGAVSLGMAARAYYGSLEDPEKALPVVAGDADIVPGVVGGLIIAAVLAAICSTADSQLLVSASAVSHDLIGRLFGKSFSPAARMAVDRAAVIVIAVIATAIAASEVRQVFDFVLDYGWAGLGAGFGPAVILTLLWRRTTGWGVLAGMVAGVGTAIAWKQFPTLQAQLYNLVPAFAMSFAVTVLVSLLEVPRDQRPDRARDPSTRSAIDE